jgi:hypothetical protein
LRESLKPSATYKYALIFLHHILWESQRKPLFSTDRVQQINDQWKNDILPIITKGRVKGVFSGDGDHGTVDLINGIPHYTVGWDEHAT